MDALRKRDTGTQTNTDTYTKARIYLKVKQPSLSSSEHPVMLQYIGFKHGFPCINLYFVTISQSTDGWTFDVISDHIYEQLTDQQS